MWIERQGDGWAVDLASLSAQLGEQGGVPAMDAIEIADGDDSSATLGGRHRLPVDWVSRHDAIRPPPSSNVGGVSVRYNRESPRVGWTVVARKAVETPWRSRRGTGERKVRAPQDAVMGNTHRPKFLPLRGWRNEGPGKCNRKIPPCPMQNAECRLQNERRGWFFILQSAFCILHWAGKGEMVGGPRLLNVRAHQQPGDRLARQTPPGARPNKGAGLVRPAMTLG